MRPLAGTPVTDADFFDRDKLQLLETKVRDGNDALDVLEHDGHLERTEDDYRLPFRLLKDWLRTRFQDHHIPLQKRDGGHP